MNSPFNEPREPNLARYTYGRLISDAQVVVACEKMGGVMIKPKKQGAGFGTVPADQSPWTDPGS